MDKGRTEDQALENLTTMKVKHFDTSPLGNPIPTKSVFNPDAKEFIPGAAIDKLFDTKKEAIALARNSKSLAHFSPGSTCDMQGTSAKEAYGRSPMSRPPNLVSQQAISRNLGFGFVRGVDNQKRLFYVVTPVPPEEMQSVNCLTLGAIILPTGIIGSQAANLNHFKTKVSLQS